ncbi:hypothetical protein KAR91_50995 [Candidatus Pacearchaeota archaeon]|nr:hypothetical protein [Candidatus Pacearchaeota archaeon]
MEYAPEKIKECLIQGLKEYFDNISTAQDGILALKAAVIALEPDLDSILSAPEQAALNSLISDQNTIISSQVYTVIDNKQSHPSHNWRRILDL